MKKNPEHSAEEKPSRQAVHLWELRDFTVTTRLFFLSILALGIGVISAGIAWLLLKLIGLCTNLFFYQSWATDMVSPAHNQLGWLVVLVPAFGGLLIGLMARYGSERIRGHGIPEALESILINGSKVAPKVALLKPISAAISIGSGGPFGAEGPIILTGGAFGSTIAQFFHLSGAERKILLVAGAAGGMSATFGAPIAAVLLAVELLLFEWKPRSLVPVALASLAAYTARYFLIGQGALFPTAVHPAFIGVVGLLSCVLVGLCAALLSILLTVAVYFFEDRFQNLPIHWMWWPLIGGVGIGIGGLIFPQALGVGYDLIGGMLQGQASIQILLGILIVKGLIWSFSLGSGTSGGVLAPLLMLGCALGGLEAHFLPNEGLGFWELISMGAVLGGAMRIPLTAVIFSLELTQDMNALVPLLVAVTISYGISTLCMSRSILTEKISRRGYHLSREYAIDPLEVLMVRDVMQTEIEALPATSVPPQLVLIATKQSRQRLYPVVNDEQILSGVLTHKDLSTFSRQKEGELAQADLVKTAPVVAYAEEPLRVVAYRMASTGHTCLPVVEQENHQKLLGLVSLRDLLKARARNLHEEERRERVLNLRMLLPRKEPLPVS